MVYVWEPGTQYDMGSVVEYEGEPKSSVLIRWVPKSLMYC